jgi:DNA repair protein RadD
MLRDYQQRAIDQLYTWFNAHTIGNPCLVLPTGSGKSHIVAALCKNALQ